MPKLETNLICLNFQMSFFENHPYFVGIKLSEGQKEAIMIASKAPIMILTGGPGCGKTYTTATIVKLWCAMKRETKLAAPTGRFLLPPKIHLEVPLILTLRSLSSHKSRSPLAPPIVVK